MSSLRKGAERQIALSLWLTHEAKRSAAKKKKRLNTNVFESLEKSHELLPTASNCPFAPSSVGFVLMPLVKHSNN